MEQATKDAMTSAVEGLVRVARKRIRLGRREPGCVCVWCEIYDAVKAYDAACELVISGLLADGGELPGGEL